MRILHVNKFLYRRGGAEAYMEDVAALQKADGHDVGFWGMAHPANTHLALASTFPPQIELEPPPAGTIAKARSAGRVLWSTSSARGFEQALLDFRPDVVHLHNIYHHLSPSILAPLRRRGIGAVMTLHDYKLACPTYQMLDHGELCQACVTGSLTNAVRRRCKGGSLGASTLAAVEVALHRRFSAYAPVGVFICPSRFLLDCMLRADVFPDRMRHVPHFIDAAAIAPAGRPGQGVIAAGRLSVEKGFSTLLRAIGMAEDLRLEIAGEGPEAESLRRLAEEVAPGRVSFLGRLGKDALHDRVRAAAVLAIPSQWYENQPMIILEAFTCGRPVVGTNLGGIPEMITEGVDGALVPAGDPAGLAAALRRFTTDPDGAHRLGLVARDKALRGFDSRTHLDQLELAYADAPTGRRSRA